MKEVYWISKIELSKYRQDNIRDCFTDQTIKFDYPNNVEEFDVFSETYRLKKAEYIENDLGENMVLDKFIVMDDGSGFADRSNEFANFLTVSRKYGVAIYLTRKNWQMMSQTKIFIFFQDLFKLVQYREYYLLLLVGIATITSLHKIFGLIKSILTYITLGLNSVSPSTHVALMI